MELIIATNNLGKVREIKAILKGMPVEIRSLLDCNQNIQITETGKTFKENAVKKALLVAKKLKRIALADDSGLVVFSLKGLPGVRSARFAGPNPTTEKLCRKLLDVMKGIPMSKRRAKFVCDIAIAFPSGMVEVVEGICKGKIIFEMRGKNGFGYDPIFVPDGYKKTFAEMSPLFKNRISHRAKALKKAKKILASILKRKNS